MDERVEHVVSGQQGTLKSQGVWYSAVAFDGEDCPSWVANDSVRRADVRPGEIQEWQR